MSRSSLAGNHIVQDTNQQHGNHIQLLDETTSDPHFLDTHPSTFPVSFTAMNSGAPAPQLMLPSFVVSSIISTAFCNKVRFFHL